MSQAATLPHIAAHSEALSGIVAALEPDAVPASQAPGMWSAFDRIERLAASAKILLARRVEDSKVWEREGFRSAADFLAQKSGTSMATSRGALVTSKRIVELAETTAVLRCGELSAAQAEVIADAASHNPNAEHTLLETASRSSLAELRDECARSKAAGDPDPDTTYKRIHGNRYLRRRRDGEGAWNLAARGTPDAGALFNAALDPIIDQIFHTAWAEGRREERQQYAFDALIEMARRARDGYHPEADDDQEPDDADTAADGIDHGNDGDADLHETGHVDPSDHAGSGEPSPDPSGEVRRDHAAANRDAGTTARDGEATTNREPRRTVKRKTRKRRDPTNPTYLALLRIDLAALQRGHTQGDELCEISGVGPIPITRARELLGDAVVKLIATKGKGVVNVTHYGRKPTTAQRMALLWSQPTCSVQGCNHSFTQIDHRRDWRYTRHTRLDELDRLCSHHHRLKTNHGWALTAGSGKRVMVPASDPRHPKQRKPSIRAA